MGNIVVNNIKKLLESYKKWKPFTPAAKIVRGVKTIDPGANDVDAGDNPTYIKENIK